MNKHQQHQKSSSSQMNIIATAIALYLLNKRKEQLADIEQSTGFSLAIEPGFPGAGPADFGGTGSGSAGAGRGKGDGEDDDITSEIRTGADIDERMGIGSQSGTLNTSSEENSESEEQFAGSSIMKTIRDVFTGGDDSDGASTIGTGGTEHGGATGGTDPLPVMEDTDEMEASDINNEYTMQSGTAARSDEDENLDVDTATEKRGSSIVSDKVETHPSNVDTVAGGGSGAGSNPGSAGVGTDPGTWGGTGR